MSIVLVCPSCQKRFAVNEHLAGQRCKCPNCATVVAVLNPEKLEEVPHEYRRSRRPAPARGGGRTPDPAAKVPYVWCVRKI
jgi:hypothetical protein